MAIINQQWLLTKPLEYCNNSFMHFKEKLITIYKTLQSSQFMVTLCLIKPVTTHSIKNCLLYKTFFVMIGAIIRSRKENLYQKIVMLLNIYNHADNSTDFLFHKIM